MLYPAPPPFPPSLHEECEGLPVDCIGHDQVLPEHEQHGGQDTRDQGARQAGLLAVPTAANQSNFNDNLAAAAVPSLSLAASKVHIRA